MNQKEVKVPEVIEALDKLTFRLNSREKLSSEAASKAYRHTKYVQEENYYERVIHRGLSELFLVYPQFNVGGFWALRIDIDINECVGIEIKLEVELTSINIQRLLGQVVYYQTRKYGKNLIVVIVGRSENYKKVPKIVELEYILSTLGITLYYLNPFLRLILE